jgi:thiamine biosynthesis lipoprotein ApbE
MDVSQKALCYFEKTGGFFDPRVIEVLESVGYDRNFEEIIPHCHSRESGNPDKKNNSEFHIPASPAGRKRGMTLDQESLEKDIIIKKDKILFNRRMDFSGIAKGYITDKAADFLKSRGFQNFLIDSGGDMYAAGFDGDDNPWNISIEGTDDNKLNFLLSDRGVATSGITRRKWEGNGKKFHHLINPKNPQEFLFDLKTATVISENTEKADIWAKTLFLMGKDKGLEFSNENGIASVFLDYKGNVFLSLGMRKLVVI